MPKPKALTFVYSDSQSGTVNLIQTRTTERTIERAWEEVERALHERKGLPAPNVFNTRFNIIYVFSGHITPLDENGPLRAATPEEKDAWSRGQLA